MREKATDILCKSSWWQALVAQQAAAKAQKEEELQQQAHFLAGAQAEAAVRERIERGRALDEVCGVTARPGMLLMWAQEHLCSCRLLLPRPVLVPHLKS